VSPAEATDFHERVEALVERLAGDGDDLQAKEREVALKRMAWLDRRGLSRPLGWPEPTAPVSPREAFKLLFLDYMGLAPEHLPVVDETDSRITWL
jgi:hypothetical protein